MSNLDKRLAGLHTSAIATGLDGRDEWVKAVHRVFIDEGWVRNVGEISGMKVVVDPNLSTGQDWHGKFDKEMSEASSLWRDGANGLILISKVRKAAKGASGVE